MSMWTPAQQRAFSRACDCCDKWDEKCRKLEEVAKHNPAFAERAAQLRAMLDNLRQTADTAISVEALTQTGKG